MDLLVPQAIPGGGSCVPVVPGTCNIFLRRGWRLTGKRGYTVDHSRVQLGQGVVAFALAIEAIRQWKMFSMPWLNLCWPQTPIEVGATVALLTSLFGFWSLNACRMVYVVNERGSSRR
jgi:uncharacterized protein (UPF0548 family)